MKLVTFYIPHYEQEKFNSFLANKKMIIANGDNISAKENDFLYIDSFINWADELDKKEIKALENLLGKFSAFTIHWRDNYNFHCLLKELSDNFLFIIDNDHSQTKTATEIFNLPFEEFDKWILGKI